MDTMITREIAGETWQGTPEGLDFIELFKLLEGETVTFPTERGPRKGKVIGYNSGGRHYLVIRYRSGNYDVRAEDITY